VAQCVAKTSLQPSGKVIAGGDYRQIVLPPLVRRDNSNNAFFYDTASNKLTVCVEQGNSSADIEACSKACCADGQCSAWAVAKGKCWLKDAGWSISKRTGGEDACAVRPKGPVPPPGPPPHAPRNMIPPSGWAGIAATIGISQVSLSLSLFQQISVNIDAAHTHARARCILLAQHIGTHHDMMSCHVIH
jgi:hypothetical protein